MPRLLDPEVLNGIDPLNHPTWQSTDLGVHIEVVNGKSSGLVEEGKLQMDG